MSDILSGWKNICRHESGGRLAETWGFAVPHTLPQPNPPLFNCIIN